MKTIFATITTIVFLSHSAQAEWTWAKTAFWKAPYPTQVSAKPEAITKNLPEICKDYSETVVNKRGGTYFDQDELDLLRRQTDSMTSNTFYADFVVDRSVFNKDLELTISRINAAANKETTDNPLPLYRQNTAELNVTFIPSSPINVVSKLGSLSKVSESVGLEPIPPRVIQSQQEVLVRIWGKDAACDFFSSQAQISFQTSAVVRISMERQQELIGLYSKFQDLVSTILTTKKTPLGKAAAYGLTVGTYFQTLERNESIVEGWIDQTLATFFDDKMDRSSIWGKLDNKSVLTVHGAIPKALNVTIGR